MLLRFIRALLRPTTGPDTPTAGVRSIRTYRGYEDYVRHQSAKLATLDLAGYDAEFEAALGARLATLAEVRPGASVLCLGARSGAECRAFSARGCFVVGLDLNPGADNRWVLPGDFHALQWADNCVDLVYCNALDHAL